MGWAVGFAVGLAVGAFVAVSVGVALTVDDGEGSVVRLADGAGLDDGDGSVGGGTRATVIDPDRSVRFTPLARVSTKAAPCSASRKLVSCFATSPGHVLEVVARRPMRMMLPLVPYVPLNELQPAKPPTLAIPNTTSRSEPSRGAATLPGAEANDSTCHVPRTGFRGAASKTRVVEPSPKTVRVARRAV